MGVCVSVCVSVCLFGHVYHAQYNVQQNISVAIEEHKCIKMACQNNATSAPLHIFTMYINFKQDFCSHAGFCARAHSVFPPTFTCLCAIPLV